MTQSTGMTETRGELTHAMIAEPTHDELTEQLFVRDLKMFVHQSLQPVQQKMAEAIENEIDVRSSNDPVGVLRQHMEGRESFGAWLAMKRESQRQLWAAVGGSVERQADALERLAALPDRKGSVRTNPDFIPPAYISKGDIHLMPGGNALDDGSLLQGAVMDRGGAVYMLGRNGGMLNDLRGQTAIAHVLTLYPDLNPTRILDMGCGVGTSSVPAAAAFPDADVQAIDVGASILRYAHARAEHLGAAVHFSQQSATSTDFDDSSFDLVYSCALLHETSPEAVPEILAESRRLLRPGGVAVHLEVPLIHTNDKLWTELADELEAQYNNEPNWRGALSLDYAGLMRAAGFSDVATGYQATAFNAHGGPHRFGPDSEGVFRSWFVASGRA